MGGGLGAGERIVAVALDAGDRSVETVCFIVRAEGWRKFGWHGRPARAGRRVSADGQSEPSPLPVLRLTFKDEALQQFIYARWKQFLAANARQRKWTKGKKPEAVHPLLVNTLEPLVYFQPGAADNLRVIRNVMQAVAKETGSSDLAAVEKEIVRLDAEIDERVYELYGLTDAEIKIVEGGAR